VTTLNGNRKRAAQVLAFNVTMLTSVLGIVVPELLTTDAVIQQFLHQLMPHLAAQALISLTFVLLPVPFSLIYWQVRYSFDTLYRVATQGCHGCHEYME
jgi:hypothetical protein